MKCVVLDRMDLGLVISRLIGEQPMIQDREFADALSHMRSAQSRRVRLHHARPGAYPLREVSDIFAFCVLSWCIRNPDEFAVPHAAG